MYHDSFASMLHLQKQLEKAAVTQAGYSSTINWQCYIISSTTVWLKRLLKRSASVQHHTFLKKIVQCKLRKSTKDSHIDLAHLHSESTVNNANHWTHINKFLILLKVVGTSLTATTGARKPFNKKAFDGVQERKTTKNRSLVCRRNLKSIQTRQNEFNLSKGSQRLRTRTRILLGWCFPRVKSISLCQSRLVTGQSFNKLQWA